MHAYLCTYQVRMAQAKLMQPLMGSSMHQIFSFEIFLPLYSPQINVYKMADMSPRTPIFDQAGYGGEYKLNLLLK